MGHSSNTPGIFGPGAGISLRRKLSGDFDIQVDFTNFSGPSVDFVQAFFNVYQDQDNQLHIKRIRGFSTDGIQTVAKVGGGGLINGAASFNPVTSGTFRITRSGSVITAFFNEAPDFSIPGFSGDVIISLVLFGPEGESASVVYDNFTINSGTLVDPLLVCRECVPLPPGAAQVQPPINADGTSIFNGRRGVVPVKLRLTCDGHPTCNLPPATIALTRTAGGVLGEVNESVYSSQADSGSNFRVLECQYHYNVNSSALGVGTYRVDILINGQVVGSATFELK